MQVSQVQDHATHVVIGGAQTIEFGISNSAEFFQILSSTLYKDQILAVVREVLCNANDAHIEAGITDKPVEITLTQDKFIIKDFGKGIHRDDIGPIYGTYGNSTKKNDGQQTGGFGLGCKAPFAYTEHFEVVSCHDGVKTIYNMSKSSGQSMGKPGIVPIASFPTTETGLQVTIGIKSSYDRARFLSLIYRIVRNGDMNMTLNANPLERLGFDTTKSNYMVTTQENIVEPQPRIMVRYGNVIYPIDSMPKIAEKYSAIIKHLNNLVKRYDSTYYIVFQAPPHSIAVTPSRESLSMQDHTINTLNGLFGKFLELVEVKFKAVCSKYAEKSIELAVEEENISELLSTEIKLPRPKGFEIPSIERMFDMETMANRYMQLHYPDGMEFRKEDITRRLKLMVKVGMLDKGKVQTFLREMNDVKAAATRKWGQPTTTWLQKQILAPLLVKAINSGLDRNRLYTYDQNMDGRIPYGKPPLRLMNQSRPSSLFHTMPYLRNIVVVSASLKDIWERAKRHQVFQDRGQYHGFIFYHATMKKDEKEAALKFFNNQHMEVVDLTVRQEWEEEPEKDITAKPIIRKPPKTGIVALSAIISTEEWHDGIHTRHATKDDAKRIESPEFIVNVSFNRDTASNQLPGWDNNTSRIIVDLFGDKGGITNNDATAAKWKDKGALMFKEFISKKVVDYISNSTTIKEYWAFKPSRLHDDLDYDEHNLIDALYAHEISRKSFNLVNNLTDEDQLYLALWDYKTENRYARNHLTQEETALIAQLEAIPIDQINKDLLKKFDKNPLLGMIDSNGFNRVMAIGDPNSPTVKKAIEILVAALNQ